jgi:hypothetical protein
MYVTAWLVLSVPTTSVDSKWAIPVLTTAVESLHIHSRCYYRSRKVGMSSCRYHSVLWAREEERHAEEKSNQHVMDNHASCAHLLRDAFLVTLNFVTRVASPM